MGWVSMQREYINELGFHGEEIYKWVGFPCRGNILMGWVSMQRKYINGLGFHAFFPPLHYMLFAITLSAVRHYTNLLFAITLSAVRHYTSAVCHYTIFCPPLHFCSPPLHYLLSAITLSAVRHYTSTVLRFTVSDYPFSILKLLFNIF